MIPALNLRADGVGIDDRAAVDRADDASDTYRPLLRHFDLGNLRHVGRKDELQGGAQADPFRQFLAPARLFGVPVVAAGVPYRSGIASSTAGRAVGAVDQ